MPHSKPQPAASQQPPIPQNFAEVVSLITQRRDLHLLNDVERHIHLVHCDQNRIEFRPGDEAPDNLPGRLGQALEKWTGHRWVVSVSNKQGAPTIAEQRQAQTAELEAQLRKTELVQAAFYRISRCKSGARGTGANQTNRRTRSITNNR